MLPSPNFCVPSQFVNWSAQPLKPPSEMYASALHDMRSTKARKLSMELSVNWTSFVAKSFVQLVTRVCMGGSKHSPTRIAHRATNSGDSIFRNGENTMRLPKQHAESLVCYIKFITGDSSPPSSPCHRWYGEATSSERAPMPWLQTATICHSILFLPYGMNLTVQR